MVNAGVPFLLMTATCLPSLRPSLLAEFGITDCHIIHAPTNRPEISYNVTLTPTLDEAKAGLVNLAQKRLEKIGEDRSFRGLVYCRSKADVEEIAGILKCRPFHADRPAEERANSYRDWVEGKEKLMVCTSLLGCGIDVEGVALVLHLGTPWSILDFAQESGRAGRGGNPSISMVFASNDERPPDDDDEDLFGKRTMREWVLQDSVCRRSTLSSFLDEGRTTCALLAGAKLCDVCRVQSKEPHPDRLTKFPTPTIPNGEVPKPLRVPHIPPTSLAYEAELNQATVRDS